MNEQKECSVDWAWCFENPRQAAAEIDRLQRELAGANATIAHFLGPDGERHIDRFAAVVAAAQSTGAQE